MKITRYSYMSPVFHFEDLLGHNDTLMINECLGTVFDTNRPL